MHFNTKTITRILDLSVRQIDYWDRTHFIKPSICEASGYGSVRLYSFNNLVQLKVAKTLMDKGISPQKIRKAINYLKKNLPEVKKPLSEIRFLTDGETIFVLTEDKKVIIDVLKNGQLVFAVALGKINEDLKGEVITLQKEKKYEVTVKSKKYSVILHPDTENRGHFIECPAITRSMSRGDTVEEAIKMIRDTITGHLEAAGGQRKIKKVV